MSDPPPLFLIRHGQTEWNAQKRLQGGKDSPLTEQGERQAKAMAAALLGAAPDLVLASPLGRAKRTARIIAKTLDASVELDPRLAEMRFGEAEGLRLTDVDERWPGFREKREQDKWHVRWPGGENYEDASLRIAAFAEDRLTATLRGEASRPLVIVAHETINKVLIGHLLGMEQAMIMRLGQPNHVLYRLAGRRVDHAYLGDDSLDWTPGLLQKRSDEILEVAA